MWCFFAGTGAGAIALASPSGVFLGRPRRLVLVPPRASIARFSLSRSAISKSSICSVGISSHRSTGSCLRRRHDGPLVDKTRLSRTRSTLGDVRKSKAALNSTCTTRRDKCGLMGFEQLQLDCRLLAAFPAMDQDLIIAAADEREILGVEQWFHCRCYKRTGLLTIIPQIVQ
jgi:hypothetical protein